MSDITWTNDTRKLSELIPWAHNPKRMTKKQADGLRLSIEHFGVAVPFLISPNNDIYDGHQRQTLMTAMREHGGNAEVDVRVSSRLLTDDERRELIVRLKQNQAGWDFDMLPNLYEREELLEWGFEPEELGMFDEVGGDADSTPEQARQTLAERFLVPPFSVLDARQGYWQTRKSAWLALGIRGELGRGFDIVPNGTERSSENDGAWIRSGRIKGKLPADSGGQPMPLDRMKNGKSPARKLGQDLMRGRHVVGEVMKAGEQDFPTGQQSHDEWFEESDGNQSSGTSIFDPVLCEIAFRWFNVSGGHILDPFAGEATKGIVATFLGYPYTGIELRPEQVEANNLQAKEIGVFPNWICGDSEQLETHLPAGAKYDLIFTSPPYYDLEIYSEGEKDGSAFDTYEKFIAWYRRIFAQAVARLNDDRFVVVKIGEIRDRTTGAYRNFVGDNISCFIDLGLAYHNEAVLVTALGSLPIRAGKQFSSGRKLGKTHQNILVFYKGDPRNVKRHFPTDIEYAELPAAESD